MRTFTRTTLFLCTAALVYGAFIIGFRTAQAAPSLPPGMTPAVYRMVMTAGPAHPAGMPAGLHPYLGCIPTMGYHYAAIGNWPMGPIYGYYQGKLIFSEVMLPQSAFAQGRSWDNILQPLPGHTINHVDIWFTHGHAGYMAPHYDIHAWYVPHSEHMYYCHNTSGTRPAWLR